MEAVDGLLAKLAADGDFQDDLHQPQVRVVRFGRWVGVFVSSFSALLVLVCVIALMCECLFDKTLSAWRPTFPQAFPLSRMAVSPPTRFLCTPSPLQCVCGVRMCVNQWSCVR